MWYKYSTAHRHTRQLAHGMYRMWTAIAATLYVEVSVSRDCGEQHQLPYKCKSNHAGVWA